jgi:transposase-like protein
MIEFKGSHCEREVILWGVRWYVAYPISYQQLEEMIRKGQLRARGKLRPSQQFYALAG